MTHFIQRLLLVGSIGAAHLLVAQQHSIERYTVDSEVAHILDEHHELIAEKLAEVDAGAKKHAVWKFEWLPQYYVKYGLARIEGMEKMQKAIDRCNLTSLCVADKRLYHVRGNSKALSSLNYAVVIEEVKGVRNPPPMTLAEAQQLCRLMHETGYICVAGPLSKKGPNYIRTHEGKYCMIDTESSFKHEKLLKGFLRFLRTHDLSRDLSPEALKHLFKEVRQLLEKQPEKTAETLLALETIFKKQKSSPSWDYQGYCHKYFKKLEKKARR